MCRAPSSSLLHPRSRSPMRATWYIGVKRERGHANYVCMPPLLLAA